LGREEQPDSGRESNTEGQQARDSTRVLQEEQSTNPREVEIQSHSPEIGVAINPLPGTTNPEDLEAVSYEELSTRFALLDPYPDCDLGPTTSETRTVVNVRTKVAVRDRRTHRVTYQELVEQVQLSAVELTPKQQDRKDLLLRLTKLAHQVN